MISDQSVICIILQYFISCQQHYHLVTPGVNCTKTDLDAIISGRDDVEILDYNSELYYEKYYE